MMQSSSSGMDHHQEQPRVTVLTAGGVGNASAGSSTKSNRPQQQQQQQEPKAQTGPFGGGNDEDDIKTLELEPDFSDNREGDDHEAHHHRRQQPMNDEKGDPLSTTTAFAPYSDDVTKSSSQHQQQSPHNKLTSTTTTPENDHTMIWLLVCFLGIMASFVCYGLLLEYTTSGGRQLHELSFLFVTSGLYTLTAAAGRHVRDETPTTIPPARFAILGLTSMGSTFCSVRSLRYVIYPIQVLAKSCKPVPVMLMGALMGKRYPLRKYVNVVLIVLGVALFMGGGDSHKKSAEPANDQPSSSSSSSQQAQPEAGAADRWLAAAAAAEAPSQIVGILLLFASLCFDGGTGAYEDKLMSVHSVQPFDLMYNIQLGKTILAGIGLLVLNQLHIFIQMVQEMGFLLVALGLSGALGQVFIFVTIAKFGALTCSIIGLARKVTTLVASIYFYGHSLNTVQFTGLVVSVTAMVLNFWGKKKGPSSSSTSSSGNASSGGGGGGSASSGHHHHHSAENATPEEVEKMLLLDETENMGDVELASTSAVAAAAAASAGGSSSEGKNNNNNNNKPNFY